MKTFTVATRGFGRGQKCVQCRRTLKVGDCGFAQEIQNSDFSRGYGTGGRTLFWHRACIELLLAEAPLDSGQYMREFRALEEKAKEGDLF